MATPITYALRFLSTFFPPQKPLTFSGLDSTLKLVDLILAAGYQRPLLVADSFLIDNNKLTHVIEQFEQASCKVTIYSGAIPNPTMTEVRDGLALSLDNDCDCVLAIGGGSVLDIAKVIAAASTSNKDVSKLVGILKVKQPPLPFYAVPTTSGTGSETTNAAVVSDPATHKKQFFVDPKYIPAAVALDPFLLKSLPAPFTAAVGMDALTHAIEAYTSRNNFADTDRDAATAIKLLFQYLPVVYHDGENIKARELVAQASFLAGYSFTKSSLGYVHAISHQVSAKYNTPHGLANAIILPRVLRFNQQACAQRYANLERLLSGETTNTDDNMLAQKFIARVDQLSNELQIPNQLADLKAADFTKIRKDALAEARSSYAVPKVMRGKDVEAILQSIIDGNKDVTFS